MDGLSVEEVLMPRGLRVGEHAHDGAQLYFVLEGEYVETSGGEAHLLRPGAAWLRPPRARHENAVVGDDALTLIVTVEPRRYASLARRCPAPRPLQSLLLDDVRAEILRELRRGDDAALALEGWSLLLLSRVDRLLARDPPAAPEWLGDALQLIERAYREPLTLAGVAAQVGVHRATLAAAFRRFLGTSVGERIRELRLAWAREALVATRRPLKELALEAGFYDQAHFGRCFKARYGISPASLRA
ncbi:MAG TPA: AraC family transcriptional regulator [Thermoanaerobaculia bacterium]|nr:AraC family transcriptional regulator [Thermoanaerobaculia bacterium]